MHSVRCSPTPTCSCTSVPWRNGRGPWRPWSAGASKKLLAVAGEKADAFAGTEEQGLKLCPLTNENATALMALFPYTKPASHKGH